MLALRRARSTQRPVQPDRSQPPARLRIDCSKPVFVRCWRVLACSCCCRSSWLAYYSRRRQGRRSSRSGNFAALVSDPTLRKPFLVAIGMALARRRALVRRSPRRWRGSSRAPTCRAARIVRALVTASFVTPPFLGAIAWEILAAPNSGLLNVAYCALFGARAVRARCCRHLHASRAWCSRSPATPSPTCSRWSPTRSTACRATWRKPRRSWARRVCDDAAPHHAAAGDAGACWPAR